MREGGWGGGGRSSRARQGRFCCEWISMAADFAVSYAGPGKPFALCRDPFRVEEPGQWGRNGFPSAYYRLQARTTLRLCGGGGR